MKIDQQMHLCVPCLFHLADDLGDFIVSTVGEPKGRPLEEVGSGRLYETYVFRAKDGAILEDAWNEIDGKGSGTRTQAFDTHRAMVKKWKAE